MLILEQIPMREDNYSYAVIKNDEVIMIDPSEETASIDYFKNRPELRLKAILNTHSHPDHVGGNDALWQLWHCPVFAPRAERERVPHCSHDLVGGEHLNLLDITIEVHDVHAHTVGHLAYLINKPFDIIVKQGHQKPRYHCKNLDGHGVIFVGDSLFAAGCGRLFEGTPQDLAHCLSFYARQSKNLLMACAHEYTVSNLKFAAAIFETNFHIKERLNNTLNILADEGASVPCLMEDEFLTNPFLLALGCERDFIAQKYHADKNDLSAIVGALRKAKDNF